MKVAVDEITGQDLVIEEDIDFAAWDMNSVDIRFTRPGHCRAVFNRVGKNIRACLHCEVNRTIVCSRCLEELDQKAVHDFEMYYQLPAPGDFLEIDADIRENILLQFPMKVLCSPDCRGLCPGCGKNLNREKCICPSVHQQT